MKTVMEIKERLLEIGIDPSLEYETARQKGHEEIQERIDAVKKYRGANGHYPNQDDPALVGARQILRKKFEKIAPLFGLREGYNDFNWS